jgi:hypothetical protein
MPWEGSEDHGGNCLGSVRMCGHFPARARSVMWWQACRREVSSSVFNGPGMTTKPSRSSSPRKGIIGAVAGTLSISVEA